MANVHRITNQQELINGLIRPDINMVEFVTPVSLNDVLNNELTEDICEKILAAVPDGPINDTLSKILPTRLAGTSLLYYLSQWGLEYDLIKFIHDHPHFLVDESSIYLSKIKNRFSETCLDEYSDLLHEMYRLNKPLFYQMGFDLEYIKRDGLTEILELAKNNDFESVKVILAHEDINYEADTESDTD